MSPKALIYGVSALEVPKAKVRYCARAVPEFDTDLVPLNKPPAGSTIYLELVIQPAAQTEPLNALPEVGIKWQASAQVRHIALIITSGADGKWTARTTEQDVTVELKEVGVDEIIFGTAWAFARLLFFTSPVSGNSIERMISKLQK